MKNKSCLALLLIMIISVLLSCQQSDSSVTPDTPSIKYSNVTFWINENASTITVTFYGDEKKITKYYPGYDPSCGSSGCANFKDIPYGSYYYTASNYWGTYTWSGYIDVKVECTLVRLPFNKDFDESKFNDAEHLLIEADEFDYECLE